MRNCAICKHVEKDGPTCAKCGEASWLPGVASLPPTVPEPKPVPLSTVEKPEEPAAEPVESNPEAVDVPSVKAPYRARRR